MSQYEDMKQLKVNGKYVLYLYYTGWTNDLDKRLKAHNGGKSGAKYTRNRRPVTLVYYEEFQEKQEAMKREYAIKQLTRKEKENLIKEKNIQ